MRSVLFNMNILPSTEVLDSSRFPEINQTHASDRLIKMHDRVIHDPREEICLFRPEISKHLFHGSFRRGLTD